MQQNENRNGAITVLRADVERSEQIAPLLDAYRQFYGQPTDVPGAKDFLEQRLTRKESVVFLASKDDESPIGFAQLYPMFSSVSLQPAWILNDLFVVPEARNVGVGRVLLDHTRAFAESTDAVRLELKTARDNHHAQKLYESLGWERDEKFFSYSLRLR